MAQANLKWVETDSSNINRVAHHAASKTLAVEFRNGGLYTYADVDEPTYYNLIGAESIGRYLNQVIKGLHTYEHFVSEVDLLNSIQH